MPIITFTFDPSNVPESTLEPVQAEINLTPERLEIFYRLRDTACERKMQAMELFIPGLTWPGAIKSPFADFVISYDFGVALKAKLPNSAGTVQSSSWISWAALDMMKSNMEVTTNELQSV